MRILKLGFFVASAILLAPACRKVVKPAASLTPSERVQLALRVKDSPVTLTGKEEAHVETNKGAFTFKLYSDEAPNTVRNFVRLADAGFYNGLIWHRYVGSFVIQGGDPLGTGYGNSGYTIDYEESGMKHDKGAVGMARGPDKNSASCQFYICLEAAPSLNGSYCVFGIVTDGMKVVKELREQDTIRSITITR